MRCERCERDNPADHLFCGYCGAALAGSPMLRAEPTPPADGPETEAFPGFVGLNRPKPTLTASRRNVVNPAPARPQPRPPDRPEPLPTSAEITEPARNEFGDGNSFHVFAPPPLPQDDDEESEASAELSGPSLLGLPNSEAEDRNLDYLLDVEPKSDYARFIVVVLIAAALSAFIIYKWRQAPRPEPGPRKRRRNRQNQESP